jgi:hypothetical protein
MAARPIGGLPSAIADSSLPPQDHSWRVVLLVLVGVVVVLSVVALLVVVLMSGLASDIWQVMTSVFDQP